MPKISLCLIVKDNEDSLRRCFYPIHKFLYEILAIDLGSKDSTKKILTNHKAQLIDFNFQNSFSAAKNKLIEAAKGDYVMFLNPDEVIFTEDMQKLADYLEKNPDGASAYMFYLQNYTNDINARGFKPSRVYGFKGYFTSEQIRLIKNDKRIKFSFAVDESLMPSLEELNAVIKHIVDVPIHNYNYKARLDLIKNTPIQSPDIRSLYNTSIACINEGNYAKAKEYLKKTAEIDPSYKKALFNLGSIYMTENKIETALKLFQKSLEFDADNIGAYYNLGLLFHQTKQLDKAELFFKKALTLDSTDFRIYRGLALIYKEQNNTESAKKAVNSALHYNPKDKELISLRDSLTSRTLT